jgi:hypothetical protein
MAHLEQRKEQYRINVEDLRRRLQEAEIARENAVQKWYERLRTLQVLVVLTTLIYTQFLFIILTLL